MATRTSSAPANGGGPTVRERAEASRAAGDLDGAVAILEEGGAPEWRAKAVAWLLEAGRTREAESRLPAVADRLLADHDDSFDALPAAVIEPLRLEADRLRRPWVAGLDTIVKARATPRGRRDRLALLAKKYRKAPIGQLAIAAASAATLAEEGSLDEARRSLAWLRAQPLAAEVADALAELERSLAGDARRPGGRGRAVMEEEAAADLPIVEEVARGRRKSVDATAEALRKALAELAGPGATCEWDGQRFRLHGTRATVDGLLDAAVTKIGG